MARPVLLKLGGSVITDKAGKPRFKRSVAKRLLGEVAKMEVPAVILHGAGSFGHPQAAKHRVGERSTSPAAASEILASAGLLHAEVVKAAEEAGLRPVSIPLHLESDAVDFPVNRIQDLLDEGHTPVLGGTLIRDPALRWRVLSADEIMQVLAEELDPRLAIFATDVEGVLPEPGAKQAIPVLSLEAAAHVRFGAGGGDDVTGAMQGKLERAFAVAAMCPTWIVNGTVRGRVMDVLKGKTVPGTRVEA